MDDSGAVDGGECGGDADGEVFEAGAAHGAAGGDELLKVRAVDELGDDEQGLALELGVQYRGGAKAPHLAGRFDLPPEPFAEGLIIGQLRTDHLDRRAFTARGLGEVDDAHPPRPSRPTIR